MSLKVQFLVCLFVFCVFLVKGQEKELFFGVNLAGAEFGQDFPGEYNRTYTYPSASELDYYSSKNLKLIRLPFKWERVQMSPGSELNTAEINRIRNFLHEADGRGMRVILDLHNYGRYQMGSDQYIIGSEKISINHIADFWQKLAVKLKDESQIWGYGIMNEPNNLLENPTWFNIAQEIIDSIRVVDSTTTIIVGGESWSSAERWRQESDNLKNLVDPCNNLVFEAHVYFDEDASGKYTGSFNTELATDTTGVERVRPFIEWIHENNLRGFVGEYGIPGDDDRWLYTLENFLSYLSSEGVNGTYWAGGPWWGGYNLSVEPLENTDKPQMSILETFPLVDTTQTYIPVFYKDTNVKISPKENKNCIHVYPNPFSTEFIIQGFSEEKTFDIITLQGRVLFSVTVLPNKIVDTSMLVKGVYFLRDKNGAIVKIMKN